jgi:hypothetical protein
LFNGSEHNGVYVNGVALVFIGPMGLKQTDDQVLAPVMLVGSQRPIRPDCCRGYR